MGVWETLHRLLGHLLRFRLQSFLLAIALLLDVAYDIFLPLSLKFLIDQAIEPQDTQAFTLIITALGIAFLIATVSAISRDYLYGLLGANVLHDVRVRLFRGSATATGARSPYSLLGRGATYGEASHAFNGAEAAGYCKVYAMESALSERARSEGDS